MPLAPLQRSTVRRTLARFWDVTRMRPGIAALAVVTSAGYIALLTYANTYVMGLIVDRVQASPVPSDRVAEVFGPYVLALLLVNAFGQAFSKLQDTRCTSCRSTGTTTSRACASTRSPTSP